MKRDSITVQGPKARIDPQPWFMDPSEVLESRNVTQSRFRDPKARINPQPWFMEPKARIDPQPWFMDRSEVLES